MEAGDFSPEARTGNAVTVFDETAKQRQDNIAIDDARHALSYTELHRRSERIAGGLLAIGLDPGDRIVLYLPNCLEFVIATLGAFRAGLPVSPANPQYRARELGYQLADSNAAAIITSPPLQHHVSEAIEDLDSSPTVIVVGDSHEGDISFDELTGDFDRELPAPDEIAMQPYTSGTTGRPKGVLLSHRNIRAQAFTGLDTDLSPDDERALVYLPLYHITGFVHSTYQVLVRGAKLYLRNPGAWDAGTALQTIDSLGITNFIGVSAMYVDMVNHPSFAEFDLSSLENVSEGGAKMPVAVQEEFEAVADVEMTEGYGLTETTGATHSGAGATFGHKIGMVGQPLRMTDCKIVDDDGHAVETGETGELLVRGPQVMVGYHDQPEATAEAFSADWFHTGDIARRDADNYYEIVDRKKHMINTAGYNVYPSEIEELLYEHPAVADAAVVGIPDDRRGETVKAYVVRKGTVSEEALKEYCLENLAPYKHPRAVAFVEELPRTASGKVQKFKLIDREE